MALGERDEQLLYERVRQLKEEVQRLQGGSPTAAAKPSTVGNGEGSAGVAEVGESGAPRSRLAVARQQLAVALSDLGTQLKLTGKIAVGVG